ncbi:hypothetical protein BC834DRAFT_869802 [Gloeopeniophorella convolvens]|nr:hypothetical protein BC834DRAFT_918236 [Gloeopeniophorella convolvens]KAI0267756.1 hypothetical protein BC834DRAFT_869802 [Gloeopeniophorella convolvens]
MIKIALHNQLIIDLTHLALFLSHCDTLVPCTNARLTIRRGLGASLHMSDDAILNLGAECRPLDWQISALAQICASLHHTPLSTMKNLEIVFDDSLKNPTPMLEPGQDEPEPEQWLELLQPFNIIEELRLKGPGISSSFCQALRTLAASDAEGVLSVLPALRELCLHAKSGKHIRALAQTLNPFVEARYLADEPVKVSYYT